MDTGQKHIYKYFADYIYAQLGIVYEEANYYQLDKRLNDICKNFNIGSFEELYDFVQKEGIRGHFKQLVLDIATNNETSFFRDIRVFSAIKNHLLPDWREENPKANIFRAWSVASSFGQELYSLAILIDEYRAKHPDFPRADIRASDISERALEKAKSGLYTQLEVQRGMSAPMLVKYFEKNDDDLWQLIHQIRSMVIFSKMNLLEISGMVGTFDLILCRNVLIYQNDENKRAILKNLSRFIVPGGLLLLGAAESLIGLSDDFIQQPIGEAFFYKKK